MRRVTVLLIAVAMLAAGCSSGTTDATATTAEAAAATTTAAPTMTVASDEVAMMIVGFGDSVMNTPNTSVAVLRVYADMVGEEFGVPVDVRDYAQGASKPAQLITTLDSEMVQASLEEADVVLVEIPQRDVQWPFQTAVGWGGSDPTDCGGDDNQQCLRDYVTENKASVEEIFAKITAMCDPSDTLIRTFTMYQMNVEDRKAEDALDITIPYFEEAQENLEVIAAGYGIPVADVHREFMGPDGTNDPRDRELLVDQRHPSEDGARLIAEMLDDLGYDPAN